MNPWPRPISYDWEQVAENCRIVAKNQRAFRRWYEREIDRALAQREDRLGELYWQAMAFLGKERARHLTGSGWEEA